MATSIVFVSETYLKTFSPIAGNVDIQMIYPHIISYQDLSIKPILGSKLYEGLQTRIDNETLTSDDRDLLDICRQVIVWGTVEMMIPFLAVQLRNKGVVENTGDTTQNADIDKLKWLQDSAKSNCEFYKKRLDEYLCKNGNLFTEYTNPDSPMSPHRDTAYKTGGIYLGSALSCNKSNLDFWRDWIK